MFNVPESRRQIFAPDHPLFTSPSLDGNNGMFTYKDFMIIASDGGGWEHVSVSHKTEARTPTWNEMCRVKDMFWDEEDCVIQFHPPASEYVNCHPYCLHLWRSTEIKPLMPPSYMVGPVAA